VLTHLFKHRGSLEAEHAPIPEKPAGFKVSSGGGGIGFFDETHDTVTLGFIITKASFRAIGADAKSDQAALLGQRHRLPDRIGKGRLLRNQVVGRQDEQDRIGLLFRHVPSRCRHSGCRVTSERFEQERQGKLSGIDLAIFVMSLEEKFAVGDGEYL
jgi:hypothetical protein